MELVVCAETKSPTRLVGRAVPIARMAAKLALGGAAVVDSTSCKTAIQAGQDLPEVLSQIRQLLGELVQSRIGRRAASSARAAAAHPVVHLCQV